MSNKTNPLLAPLDALENIVEGVTDAISDTLSSPTRKGGRAVVEEDSQTEEERHRALEEDSDPDSYYGADDESTPPIGPPPQLTADPQQHCSSVDSASPFVGVPGATSTIDRATRSSAERQLQPTVLVRGYHDVRDHPIQPRSRFLAAVLYGAVGASAGTGLYLSIGEWFGLGMGIAWPFTCPAIVLVGCLASSAEDSRFAGGYVGGCLVGLALAWFLWSAIYGYQWEMRR